jgi:hypothetical protein
MAERRNNSPLNLRVVLVSGGPPGETRFARADGHEWERGTGAGVSPNESRTAFISRVVAAAKARKLQSVVIGGLPPRGRDASFSA